jgi:hypothetical protein
MGHQERAGGLGDDPEAPNEQGRLPASSTAGASGGFVEAPDGQD